MIIVAIILFILGFFFAALGGPAFAAAAICWIVGFFIGIAASVKAGTRASVKAGTSDKRKEPAKHSSGWTGMIRPDIKRPEKKGYYHEH